MIGDDGARRIRVGVFVAGGVALLIAMLLAVGHSQRPFARRVTLHTAFRDTAGLTVGAAVRLGGVDVGTVEAIEFAPQLGVKEVSVRLRVQARYLSRIRADSRAMLTPKGLLGDMTITINVGSATATPVAAGGFIPGVEQQRIIEMVSSAYEGIDELRSLSRSVREHVDALMTPDVVRDVGRIIGATAAAAEEVQGGDGLAHALIYDRAFARDARGAMRDANRSAARGEARAKWADFNRRSKRRVADERVGRGKREAIHRSAGHEAIALRARTSAVLDRACGANRGNDELWHQATRSATMSPASAARSCSAKVLASTRENVT